MELPLRSTFADQLSKYFNLDVENYLKYIFILKDNLFMYMKQIRRTKGNYMDMLSIYLAKLLGLYFFIVGLAILFKTKHFQKSIKEISGSDALMTLISILPLAIGLSIVLGHNVWKMHWSVLITIMGWLILVISICRLFFYKKIMQIMAIKSEQKYFVMTMGVIIIIIGAVLSYLGFIGK